MPFYLPNGMVVVNEIQRAVREQLDKRGYDEIKTPQHARRRALASLGPLGQLPREHVLHRATSTAQYAVKPMNCPGACLVFGSERRSYRDLPLRLAEFGLCTRNEREGVLHGLLRVRAFTQDDAHVYCTEEQIVRRGARHHRGDRRALRAVRLRGRARRAVDAAGEVDRHRRAVARWPRTRSRRRSTRWAASTQLNPGDGAFYGPKIDFHITDALGRSWQCGTCQLDFFMPERFDLTYTTADDQQRTPVMIHRALLGSIERFLGHPDRAPRGRLPGLAGAGAGAGAADRRPPRRLCRAGASRSCARAGVRAEVDAALRVGRAQDPRRRAGEGPVHAGRGRRGGARAGVSVRRHGEGDLGLMPLGARLPIGSRDRMP